MKGKNGLAVIIGMKGGKPHDDDEEDESADDMGDEEDDEGKAEAAADDVFDALKDDDREAFAKALKSFVESC